MFTGPVKPLCGQLSKYVCMHVCNVQLHNELISFSERCLVVFERFNSFHFTFPLQLRTERKELSGPQTVVLSHLNKH